MIGHIIIDRLRSIDILEVGRKLGISLCGRETAKGRMAHCFLHKDDTPSLRLWKDVNAWKCYSCDHKGDVISLVMEYQGCDFKEACQWLAAEFNIYLPGNTLYEVTKQDATKKSQLNILPPSYGVTPSRLPRLSGESNPLSKGESRIIDSEVLEWIVSRAKLSEAAKRFLFEERKYKPEVVEELHIGSITDGKKLCDLLIQEFGEERCLKSGVVKDGKYGKYLFFKTPCLIIPYYDIDGRLLTLQSRYLRWQNGEYDNQTVNDRKVPRFQFLEGSVTSIYNQPILKTMKRHETLYIAEGVTDCIGLLSAGHKAIAIPGAAAFKPKDAELLKDFSLYMFPDKDAAGSRLFETLNHYMKVRKLQLPDSVKDFSDYYNFAQKAQKSQMNDDNGVGL